MLNTISELKRIWTDFVEEEQISPEIRPVILESWKRCKNNLVDFYGGKGKVLSDEEMKHRLEKLLHPSLKTSIILLKRQITVWC